MSSVTSKRVLKSLIYKGRNPIKRYLQPSQSHFGIGLLSHSLDYSTQFESDFYKKVFYTERTSVQLGVFYLHAWLLSHRLS